MDALLQDLRYAFRQLRRNPGFTAMAVLTLALGVGANSAIFSVVNGVLLRSLPFAQPDRVVQLYTDYAQDDHTYPLSAPDFMSFHEEADVFRDVAAYAPSEQTLTGDGDPRRVGTAIVSADFFGLMGVTPALGRAFRPEENQAGRTNVAVLSHDFWQSHFGGDASVLGRTITLNGNPREVVGVLPAGFDFPADQDVYYPLTYNSTYSSTTAEGRRGEFLAVVARLEPGVSMERAEAAVSALSDRLRREFPGTNGAIRIAMVPLSDQLLGDVRTPLLVLLGAVGLVLLIACANVANLLLSRAAAREGELAVRTAVGARRGRLITQLLTESLILGLIGGAVGLLLAYAGTEALLALRPEGIPRLDEVGIDGAVLAYTAAIALFTGLVFGLIPAIQVTRGDLTSSLKEGGRGALAGRRGNRVRGGLIVAEMALAVMLLVGAGLLIRSFIELTAVDPGFRTEQVMAFDLALPASSYGGAAAERQFFDRLLDRVRALPGVQSASAVSDLPLTGASTIYGFRIQGRQPPPPGEVQDIVVKVATPGYFRTLGIPLRGGRTLEERDHAESTPVAVLNEAAASRFFPAVNPVGQRLTFGAPAGEEPTWIEVVGVVGNTPQYGLDQDVRPELYLANDQFSSSAMTVTLGTAGDPLRLASAIRREVRALDADLPIEDIRTLGSVVTQSVAQPRFYMALLSIFAAVALVLSAIGIFGVMSYTVAQRTREIGIRMALGADPRKVLSLVVRRALLLALGGTVLGLLGAVALTRILETLLYGIAPTDVATYASVPLVLLAVAGLASWIPARAATRVDPIIALRQD